MTACRTKQCPSTKVTLCLTRSFAWLAVILHCRVFDFTAIAERGFVRDVKEKLRYICADYDTEHKSTAEIVKDKTCELPDRIINIDGAEGFRCVKVLFRPSSTGKEASGFHDTSFHNIMKCDVDIRKVVRQCR